MLAGATAPQQLRHMAVRVGPPQDVRALDAATIRNPAATRGRRRADHDDGKQRTTSRIE